MHLSIKPFAALSVNELYEILRLRNQVFVVEQACIYQDADGKDPDCLHVTIQNDGILAAYCRLKPPGQRYKEWSIGRLITSPQARGKGFGHILVKEGINEICRLGGKEIVISAQIYLEKFYQGHGFVSSGQPYLEDNIEHIEMRRPDLGPET